MEDHECFENHPQNEYHETSSVHPEGLKRAHHMGLLGKICSSFMGHARFFNKPVHVGTVFGTVGSTENDRNS